MTIRALDAIGDRILAGPGRLHAATRGQPAQALIADLEQDAGRDVMRLGRQRARLRTGLAVEHGAGRLATGPDCGR